MPSSSSRILPAIRNSLESTTKHSNLAQSTRIFYGELIASTLKRGLDITRGGRTVEWAFEQPFSTATARVLACATEYHEGVNIEESDELSFRPSPPLLHARSALVLASHRYAMLKVRFDQLATRFKVYTIDGSKRRWQYLESHGLKSALGCNMTAAAKDFLDYELERVSGGE